MSDQTISKKEKILIIDGNEAFSERITGALRTDGYTVFLVKTAAEGLKSIFDILPHLVILDLAVSEDDTYELLKKKQAEPMLAKIPIFLMSIQGMPINMRRVPAGSATEFIVSLQPDLPDIISRVNRTLGHNAELTASSAASINPAYANAKKILWAEDDKLIGSILKKKFISSGFDLIHVKDGEEVMRTLINTIPDIIIIDIILPGINGLDILQNIRKDARLKDVPVMILSNLSKPSDIERAKLLGAAKFMVKAASSLDQIVAEVKVLTKS